jgi:post-segregation antitoxin (ccd killing protein)
LVRADTRWLVEDSVAAERLSEVKRFADVVGTFAAAKQGECSALAPRVT